MVEDGEELKPGETVMTLRGPARVLLALERPMLNLASYVSGIATRTEGLVWLVKKACPKRTPRVTSTRKTLPGYRDLATYGVLAGGGHAHRLSLSGGVLIKENHIAAAGGIARAIEGAREVAPHGLKIECEVRNLGELSRALTAGADGVLLDNFKVKEVKDALKLIAGRPKAPVIEVSGGLNEDNIASYAIPGVDVLSVGSLTHSVTAVDLSLLVE
jgi:nicotinate-nucleotide pyrophosphorylase (carboxylating)